MNILDKLKSLFKKKDFLVKNVNETPCEEVSEKTSEEKKEVEEHTEEEIDLKTEEKEELLDLLNSVEIGLNDLALDKIQTESETIGSYVKGLIKDLGLHQDFKNEKDKQEQIIKSIGSKIKLITKHGLELKNLLGNLENYYYIPINDALRKVNEKAKKEEIQKLIDDLENDLNLVRTLDTQITKVIGYNELFNPEKNQKHKEEIEKEATKRIIHGDLNDLTNNILTAIIDKSIGIKAKIEKFNHLEEAKKFI